MGFLDNLREKFQPSRGDEYYSDQDYDDDYYDDDPVDEASEHVGLLGNSRRPEPESVSVYTRSGRPLSGNAATQVPTTYRDYRNDDRASSGASYRSYDESYRRAGRDSEGSSREYSSGNVTSSDTGSTSDMRGRTYTRPSSTVLPPYVLKPAAYDDVQMVVRRVRTNQPVVLVLTNTNIEAATRILDFCFGLAYGLGGEVQELGERVFVVLPAGVELSEADIDKLVNDGDLVK